MHFDRSSWVMRTVEHSRDLPQITGCRHTLCTIYPHVFVGNYPQGVLQGYWHQDTAKIQPYVNRMMRMVLKFGRTDELVLNNRDGTLTLTKECL